MRSSYQREKEHSRERSRDRNKKPYQRDQSQEGRRQQQRFHSSYGTHGPSGISSNYSSYGNYHNIGNYNQNQGQSHNHYTYDNSNNNPHINHYNHRFQRYQQPPKRKTVTFNENNDVKVFKKEDQPTAKPLSQLDIFQYKTKLENMHQSGDYVFSSQEARHKEARMQSDRLKQQKERQKSLNQKLIAISQDIPFYSPLILVQQQEISAGDSYQKQNHTQRCTNQLGCYYPSPNEIPSQPVFQLLNNASSIQSVQITYQRTLSTFNQFSEYQLSQRQKQKLAQKQKFKNLKSILKESSLSLSSLSNLKNNQKNLPFGNTNPNLVKALQDISRNKLIYKKQKVQALLQPFKESGDLQKLMSNPALYKSIIQSALINPQPSNLQLVNQLSTNRPIIDNYSPQNSNYRVSPQPVIADKRQNLSMNVGMNMMNMSMNPNMIQNNTNPNNFDQNPQLNTNINNKIMVPNPSNPQQPISASKLQRFKTVPCKYFHSSQGCVKKDDCTFIHDVNYPGIPTPNMNKYVKGPIEMEQQQAYQQNPNMMNNGIYGNPNPNSGGMMIYGQQHQNLQRNSNYIQNHNQSYYPQNQGQNPQQNQQFYPNTTNNSLQNGNNYGNGQNNQQNPYYQSYPN